jgi:hypothetical protein
MGGCAALRLLEVCRRVLGMTDDDRRGGSTGGLLGARWAYPVYNGPSNTESQQSHIRHETH